MWWTGARSTRVDRSTPADPLTPAHVRTIRHTSNPRPAPEFGLLINGPAGVGKTTMLDHVGDLLADRNRPFALMDVDWFHRSWPPNEVGNRDIEARAMGRLWRDYRALGDRVLVMSGYVASDAALRRYEDALGLDLVSIGLTAPRSVIVERLRSRHADQPRALAWHLEHLDEMLADLAAGAPYVAQIDGARGARGAELVVAAFDQFVHASLREH